MRNMADRNYTVMVQAQAGPIYDGAESRFTMEREALDPIGAEIVEVAAESDDEFIEAVKDDADALIARGRYDQGRALARGAAIPQRHSETVGLHD